MLFDHGKKSAKDANKTAPKKAIPKIAEKTNDLTGNKIADKITKVSKISSQNNSEFETEIPKERYISPKKGSKSLMNNINIIRQ